MLLRGRVGQPAPSRAGVGRGGVGAGHSGFAEQGFAFLHATGSLEGHSPGPVPGAMVSMSPAP